MRGVHREEQEEGLEIQTVVASRRELGLLCPASGRWTQAAPTSELTCLLEKRSRWHR